MRPKEIEGVNVFSNPERGIVPSELVAILEMLPDTVTLFCSKAGNISIVTDDRIIGRIELNNHVAQGVSRLVLNEKLIITGDDPEIPVTYTVTFNSNGGSEDLLMEGVESGSTIELPNPPTKEGFIFKGWYTDDETFLVEFTNETPILENITVYASWEEVVECTVTFSVIPDESEVPNGTLVAKVSDVTISSGDLVTAGSTVEFTATPDAEYTVKEWIVDGIPVAENTTNSLTVDSISKNTIVSVEFKTEAA